MLKKLLRIFLVFLLLIVVALSLTYIFISPIAKYIIEKNSLGMTGRRVTIGKVKVNLSNGSIYIKDLKIYEANDTAVFFDCHDIYLRFSIKKMLHSEYCIEKVKIDAPEITITQNGNHFNFDDLVKHFLPDSAAQAAAPKNGPPAHYYVDSVFINNGNVTYNNIPIHNIIRVHNINFKLPHIAWDNPQASLHLDFKYGTGGQFNIDLDADRKSFVYNLALSIENYDLSQYYTPLNTIIKVSSLTGQLNSKLKVHGKFNNPKDFALTGFLHITDFEIKDGAGRKTFALEKLALDVDSINVGKNMYIFHNISFDKPYFVFEDNKGGNNISEMMKHKEVPVKLDTTKSKSKTDYSNIFTLLQSSAKNMVTDFLNADYHSDIIAIRNGEFVFTDNTDAHKFKYKVTKFNLITDEVGAENKSVLFHASANLDDSGKLIMRANLTYDFKHKQFSYNIDTLKVTDVSPIAKYMLEKNSVKWTGREITTGTIKLNLVKGSVYIKDIKIYEPDSINTFFACHDVYVRINLKQMFNNTYHIEKVKIDNPEISIAQNVNHFNFDDIIAHFSKGQQPADTEKGPEMHYYIDSVMINHGNVTYTNVPLHNTYRITDLNFKLPQLYWDNPVSKIHVDFNYGTGGLFNIDMTANRSTLNYDLALSVNNFDLSQYYAALSSFMRISSLKGVLNTDLSLHGKFNSPKNVSGTGYLSVNDLEIRDTAKQKIFGLGQLTIDIDSVNVMNSIYSVNNIVLDRPFIRFDYYTKGNNISQMIKYTSAAPVKDTATGQIKPDYSNIFTLLASSIKMMTVDFVNTNYHTDSISIHNGEFVYNDYTLNNTFHYDISKMGISTNEINAKTKSIQFNVTATLNDTGKLVMYADMGLDMKNMLFKYDVKHLRIPDLNPYMEYYVATPFLDGYMDYQSVDSVINRNLKSTNIIHVEKLEVGKKTDNIPIYKMPIHLAVSLLKDEKGNIDLRIPANGNLDDPNYKIGPLLGRILSDIVVKTAESPFKHLAKLFEHADPEEMKRLDFEYMQEKLEDKQLRKLEDIYKVLDKK